MWEFISRTLRWLGTFIILASPVLWKGKCACGFAQESKPAEITDNGQCPDKYPDDCSATKISMKNDICNFHKVDQDVYRGARPRRSDAYSRLAELGIRTIVNLEGSKEAAREKAQIDQLNQTLVLRHKPSIDFISFPINSITQIPLTGVSDQKIGFLFQQIQEAKKPIFIHCEHGKDRTGAVVVLYRIKRKELTFDQAYKEALYYRFNKWLDRGLKSTINRYKNQEKLNSLPAPDPSAVRPEDVCVGGAFHRHQRWRVK